MGPERRRRPAAKPKPPPRPVPKPVKRRTAAMPLFVLLPVEVSAHHASAQAR